MSKKTNKLIREIDELLEKEYINPRKIIEISESKEESNARLELSKDRLIRILVISDYVLINEFFDVIVRNFFFKKSSLRRDKRIKLFDQHILERLTLINKLDLVNEFFDLKKQHKDFVYSINGLRNCFAHSFFPAERRREKPIYKGKSMYKLETIEKYKEDYDELLGVLSKKAFGVDISEI